jgi:dynein heavy chain 1
VKEEQLREKNIVANQKLQKMGENKTRLSAARQKPKGYLLKSIIVIPRLEEVEKELLAEPALQSARTSVRGIKPAQLNEVRALARPPNGVRLTMEAVCVMLGERTTEIRRIIRGGLY